MDDVTDGMRWFVVPARMKGQHPILVFGTGGPSKEEHGDVDGSFEVIIPIYKVEERPNIPSAEVYLVPGAPYASVTVMGEAFRALKQAGLMTPMYGP